MNHQPLYGASYRLLNELPDPLWSGDTLLLRIELTNTGTIPWLNFGLHPVRLSYHWRAANAAMAVHDGLRAGFRDPIAPGESATVELRVVAPPEPGQYELQLDLLEEGIAWFSDRGVQPLAIAVTFQPTNAPRATIINGNVVINDAVGNHIVAQLKTLRGAGFQPLILTEFVDERLPIDVRRHIETVRLRDLDDPPPHLRHAIEHWQASEIVIVNYSTYYDLARSIAQTRGASVIFDYHGITPPSLWDRNAPGYDDLVRGQQHLALVQHADYAIGHSRFTCEELIATGVIASNRVRQAPYPVVANITYADQPPADLIEAYGLQGRRVLLYVGRMARNKRINDLIEAMPSIIRAHPAALLVLVGENTTAPYRDYVAEVQARAVELGVADHVLFTGQVPDVEPLYALADVFVTASVHEGFCFPVVEAMARGTPVVAANTTALPETVGDAGLLFDPFRSDQLAAQVIRLLDDRSQPATPDPALPKDKRIAFVAPRYGAEILGGAERLVRGFAEHLAARGYRVEVLTTCVASMADWTNVYEPGVHHLNGVTVRRFPIDTVDPAEFHRVLVQANRGDRIRLRDERSFMQNNLRSSALDDYLRDHADELACAIFAPYLFGTTYWAMQAIPDKAILIPCLHDEPSAYLALFREMLERAAGLFFNADAECRFAVEKLHVANPQRAVTGYGFDPDPPAGDAAAFRDRYNLPEPLLLYSGRLERGKNVPLLIEYFVRFKNEHPRPLTLALTGRGNVPLPDRPDVVGLEQLPEAEMHNAYAAALALCQPSLNESFSIVLMESWLQGRPVLVHADSAVTSEHVTASGGGYAFADYDTFAAALQRVLDDPDHAAQLGQHGRAYVQQHYAWDVVIDNFLHQIAAAVQPRGLYEQLQQRGIVRALQFTPARFDDALLGVVEQALGALGVWTGRRQGQLRTLGRVGRPDYAVRSDLPVVGRLIGWARRQMTAHLKEPYLDPIVQQQQQFNQQVIETVLPALEHSQREQRRLQREVELLREQINNGDDTRGATNGTRSRTE
jgi:O-antigen biosynthesis protein